MDKYDDKLSNAEYHLKHIRELQASADHTHLDFELRAFAAAARCISQYAFNDARLQGVRGEQAYERLVTAAPILRGFKELRDEDIHTAPTHTERAVRQGTVHVVAVHAGTKSDPLSIRLNVVSHTIVGWKGPGTGEVVPSCEEYLRELRRLLAAAAVEGWLCRGGS